ncbi:fumarylacetoacetase [Acidicapsa dinghuensis]|uniref:fumarylacetoacetase n=1 Tax=Acidicapsa dinghuensis TaxID=2218256 RepID=A0ABW1EAI7_9BACT|nr:fumarylacetoacetase [Acidicapsa dinghuensis]
MAVKSWLASANELDSDFPIQNLPYGVFRYRGQTHIGIAIGDQILDLDACVSSGLFKSLPEEIQRACQSEMLNELMALGPDAWSELRMLVTSLLDTQGASGETQAHTEAALLPISDATMQLPAQIGDYTDFYASIDHATRVGKLFRPDNPLLPNYKHIPIGYHGRASSIVISGCDICRPCGQTKAPEAEPTFGPAKSLDYELEVGIFIGPGNLLGESISIDEAERHIFGLCLVNDWSARDMQTWEYQPLGPFLAKSFATTISPWVVPLEALAPYRVPARKRAEGAPDPLSYLKSSHEESDGIDLTLEVYLDSRKMREAGIKPERLSCGNLRDLYWSIAQLVTHHTSNGCNLRAGDLLATGTVSGPEEGSEGCLLEMRHRAQPLRVATGEQRTFLQDGDRVILRAFAQKPGLPRIGFGECTGTITKAIIKQ